MEPEFLFWFALTIKMVVTALFVTLATVIAERLGPTVGALVATLPVSAGPVYVFLALDHDAAFISASAVASLALNAITAIYVTVYVLLAQRRTMWVSVSLAFAVWLAAALVLGSVQWNAWWAFILNLVVFTLCFFIVEPFAFIPMPPTTQPWYDFVVRSSMVALLVAAVVLLSFRIGPTGTGVLAVFPIIYTSIMVILHHRVGGPGDGRGACKCRSRPSRIRCSIADAASHSSIARYRHGTLSRPRRVRRLERRRICDTAPPSPRLSISLAPNRD